MNLSTTEFFLKIKSHDSEEENTIRTISEKVSKVIRKTFNFQDLKKAHMFSMFLGKKSVLSSTHFTRENTFPRSISEKFSPSLAGKRVTWKRREDGARQALDSVRQE